MKLTKSFEYILAEMQEDNSRTVTISKLIQAVKERDQAIVKEDDYLSGYGAPEYQSEDAKVIDAMNEVCRDIAQKLEESL